MEGDYLFGLRKGTHILTLLSLVVEVGEIQTLE